jgi:hypothetical protein
MLNSLGNLASINLPRAYKSLAATDGISDHYSTGGWLCDCENVGICIAQLAIEQKRKSVHVLDQFNLCGCRLKKKQKRVEENR